MATTFPNLTFDNVHDDHLRDCFVSAYAEFPELHAHPLRLEQRPLEAYTMRAQPLLNWSFWRRKNRHYRIQISNHLQIARYVELRELRREVLVGWFAHELGHLMDYRRRGAWSMIQFILGYITFATYRAGAERRADLYAIERGFGPQLMATKMFILEKSKLPNHYKDRIRRYYLSPAELEDILLERKVSRRHF